MTHDEARESLATLALDALSAEERERVMAHVSTCAECRRELASLQGTADMLALAAPVAPIDGTRRSAMRERLVARAAAEGRSREAERDAVTAVTPLRTATVTPPRARRSAAWLAVAASLVVAAALGWLALRERDRARDLQRQVASLGDERTALRLGLDSSRSALARVLSPTVRIVELTSSGDRQPGGRMFWDQATDSWTFVAHDLPELSSGRTYQLWLIDASQQRISAGTFAPRPDGRAIVQAQYRLPPDALAMVAVTEEPEGGVAQPTGEIVIAGRAGR